MSVPESRTRKILSGDGDGITTVPRRQVLKSLELFRKRIEHRRQNEASYYSLPSDKTRIRVLK